MPVIIYGQTPGTIGTGATYSASGSAALFASAPRRCGLRTGLQMVAQNEGVKPCLS
jgi:hypothetical protein